MADSLAVVAPWLSPELVPAAAIPALTAVASALPPIHRAGFECRLAADDDQVDLQQGVSASDHEPAHLAAFLSSAGSVGGAWKPLRCLAERWATAGDPVHADVAELWLELDIAPGVSGPTPSVFAVLKESNGERTPRGAQAVVETLVGPEQAASPKDLVRRLQRDCPALGRVTHVGVMLGRPVPSFRVHVRPVQLRGFGEYLRSFGWSDEGAAVETARMLLNHGDLLILCLEPVGDRIERVGLECFFAQKRGVSPRWRSLLNDLVALRMCAPEKAEALLQWPGTVTPFGAEAPWPETLIVQGLTSPPDVLSVFERQLSHVKVTCASDEDTSAKAYFGYVPRWAPAKRPARQANSRLHVRPAPTRAAAIDAAVGRLLQMRNQAGGWRDFFGTRHVDSGDEWVTAYVADALASAPVAGARAAAREALELLLGRRDTGSGWAYHALLPPDGDATTWVLRLARSLGEPERGRLAAGRGLLESLTSAKGGVSAYPESAAALLARLLGVSGSYAGWCRPHTCITAAAAVLGISPATPAYLLASQSADGSWSGYWWEDNEYATAWAVESLAGHGAGDPAVSAAIAWCSRRIGPDGAVESAAHAGPSPFATGLVLHAIRTAGSIRGRGRWGGAARRAERWLLEHQLEDGSWEPSARMQAPAPSAVDPRRSTESMDHILDQGAFTTATVLRALSAGRCSLR